jgi:hypothetical protein
LLLVACRIYNKNGYLSNDELSEILQLNPMQLQEVVKRMNELDRLQNDHAVAVENETAVSRACFVHHFLGVLQETQHFGQRRDEGLVERNAPGQG